MGARSGGDEERTVCCLDIINALVGHVALSHGLRVGGESKIKLVLMHFLRVQQPSICLPAWLLIKTVDGIDLINGATVYRETYFTLFSVFNLLRKTTHGL